MKMPIGPGIVIPSAEADTFRLSLVARDGRRHVQDNFFSRTPCRIPAAFFLHAIGAWPSLRAFSDSPP